jgi:sn-glycerol 3-phosphate transport system permease protein
MERRTIFDGWFLPVVLVLPQLVLTGFFFLWPAGEAIWSSLTRQDPFGLSAAFVGRRIFPTCSPIRSISMRSSAR